MAEILIWTQGVKMSWSENELDLGTMISRVGSNEPNFLMPN